MNDVVVVVGCYSEDQVSQRGLFYWWRTDELYHEFSHEFSFDIIFYLFRFATSTESTLLMTYWYHSAKCDITSCKHFMLQLLLPIGESKHITDELIFQDGLIEILIPPFHSLSRHRFIPSCLTDSPSTSSPQ